MEEFLTSLVSNEEPKIVQNEGSKKLKFTQNMTMVQETPFRPIGKLSETYQKIGQLDLPQSI